MKIAFFTETFLPKVDGIVTRLTKTVRHLVEAGDEVVVFCPEGCLLYTSPSPRDGLLSRMPSSA